MSSAFTLAATDRALLVGVSSAAANTWYAAFQPIIGGAWLRYLDPWSSVTSQAMFSGTNGAWGVVVYPPSSQVRIETSAAVSATTSFALIEVHG